MAPVLVSSLFFPDSALREWERVSEGERFLPDPSSPLYTLPPPPCPCIPVVGWGSGKTLDPRGVQCSVLQNLQWGSPFGALCIFASPQVPAHVLCLPQGSILPRLPCGGVDAQHGVDRALPAPPNAEGTRNGDGKNP